MQKEEEDPMVDEVVKEEGLAFALTVIGESAIRTEMEGFFLEISNALKEKEEKEANRGIIVRMVFWAGLNLSKATGDSKKKERS